MECFTATSEEDGPVAETFESTDTRLQQGIKEAENPNASTKKTSQQESPPTVPNQNRPENQGQKKGQEYKRTLRRYPYAPQKKQ